MRAKLIGMVAIGLLMLTVGAAGVAASQHFGQPEAPPADATVEEIAKWKQEFLAWAERDGRLLHLSGPKTMGKSIVISDQSVQLPADAFVEYFFTEFECDLGTPCPEVPVYRIKRGPSTIDIEARTGRVWWRVGDQRPFDFLKGAITGEVKK